MTTSPSSRSLVSARTTVTRLTLSRAASARNGSTRRALQAGALAETDLTEVGEIGAYQRGPDAITIACLVGIGVQDVVAAETALAIMQHA